MYQISLNFYSGRVLDRRFVLSKDAVIQTSAQRMKTNMDSRALLFPVGDEAPIPRRSSRSPLINTDENEGTRLEDPNRMLDSSSSFEDFRRDDPEDDIFEEVETVNAPEPQDWRSRRPHVLKSLAESAWVVVGATFLGGIVLGLFAVACFYVDINTAHNCHWIENENLPRNMLSLRVSGEVLECFMTEYWPFLILWFVFGWPLMKELNLPIVAILMAFLDVFYRLRLHVFHSYKRPFVPYPINGLFIFTTLYCSYAIGRRKFPESSLNAIKLSAKLSVQLPVQLRYFQMVRTHSTRASTHGFRSHRPDAPLTCQTNFAPVRHQPSRWRMSPWQHTRNHICLLRWLDNCFPHLPGRDRKLPALRWP